MDYLKSSQCFKQGWQARHDDRPITSNPYHEDSDDYADWENGWEAHDDAITGYNPN